MFPIPFLSDFQALSTRYVVLALALFAGNLLFTITANSCFKFSAVSPTWRSFLTWQVFGNLAGFITVLTLTGLLRLFPLHMAYPITVGLGVIGVQVVAARLLFGEFISSPQWLGTTLVVVGIVLISGR